MGEFRGIMGSVGSTATESSERKGRCQRQRDPKPRRSASLGLVDCITSLYNLQNGATSAVTVKHKVTTLPCVVQQLCCRAGPCGCEAALVMPRLGRCCMPHSGGRWHWSEAIGDGGHCTDTAHLTECVSGSVGGGLLARLTGGLVAAGIVWIHSGGQVLSSTDDLTVCRMAHWVVPLGFFASLFGFGACFSYSSQEEATSRLVRMLRDGMR